MTQTKKKVCKFIGMGVVSLLILYVFSILLLAIYWEQRCLKAGFLRVGVAYDFAIYCQDGNKSIPIGDLVRFVHLETLETQLKESR